MERSRLVTALAGLVLSIAVSVALYYYFHTVFVFFFVPFVPFLLRGGDEEGEPAVRRCPTCGFETRSLEYDYCPRDGTELD